MCVFLEILSKRTSRLSKNLGNFPKGTNFVEADMVFWGVLLSFLVISGSAQTGSARGQGCFFLMIADGYGFDAIISECDLLYTICFWPHAIFLNLRDAECVEYRVVRRCP